MKTCTKCKKSLALTEFYKNKVQCKDCHNYTIKLRYQVVRKGIVELLGSKCVCCGETEPAFLQVDHVNNDGHKDRADGKNVYKLLEWVTDDPTRFQILCANCHNAKTTIGRCPHDDS